MKEEPYFEIYTKPTTLPQHSSQHPAEPTSQEQQQTPSPPPLPPKSTNKQKLIQQNIHIKTQIYQLSVQLDQIMQKDKNKKKSYGIHQQQTDWQIRQKKLSLKKQQLQICEVKNKIFQYKRQLENEGNYNIIIEKQNKLKHTQKMLSEVQNQKQGLMKIKKMQAKAIKFMKGEDEFNQKIQKTHQEYLKVKQQTQNMMAKVTQAQKNELIWHEKYISKVQKIRQLQQKVATTTKSQKQKEKQKEKQRQKNKNTAQTNDQQSLAQFKTPALVQSLLSQRAYKNISNSISNQILSDLEQEIKKLEAIKKQKEKVWQDKIRMIENEIQLKKMEEQKKIQTLKEKQKQQKMNEIKIKQLRKLVKQNITDTDHKKMADMDMSQYRHKRNIKYMEK